MKRFKIFKGVYFISIALGIASSFMAHICTNVASTTGWLIQVFAAALCVPPIVLSKRVCDAEKNENMLDVIRENKLIFKVVKIILSVVFFALSVFLCNHFSYIIHLWILQNVDIKFISAGLCVLLYIALSKDRKSLYYTVVFFSVFCILAVLILRLNTVFSGKIEKILPVFEKERLNIDMVRGVFYSFGVFSAAFLSGEIYEKKTTNLEYAVGLGGTALLFILSIFSCNMLLGATQTANSFDAIILAMRKSNVLGRGDVLFFAVWMFFIASAFCCLGFAPRAISEKKEGYGANVKLGYCGAIFVLSGIVGKYFNQIEWLLSIMAIGCGSMLYSVSIIAFLLSGLKKRREGSEA